MSSLHSKLDIQILGSQLNLILLIKNQIIENHFTLSRLRKESFPFLETILEAESFPFLSSLETKSTFRFRFRFRFHEGKRNETVSFRVIYMRKGKDAVLLLFSSVRERDSFKTRFQKCIGKRESSNTCCLSQLI